MKRFKKIQFQDINIEMVYCGRDESGDYYRFKEKDFEVWTDDFTIIADFTLYHSPEAINNDGFEISNIKINTDYGKLKISDQEYTTIQEKIKDSIKIIGLNSWY